MKTQAEIKQLLRRYFEGETSTAQERELAGFFRQNPGPLDEELEDARELFAFFEAESAVEPCRTSSSRAIVRKTRLRRWSMAVSAAAAVACVAIVFFPHNDADRKIESYAIVDGQKITDPEQVMAEYYKITARIRTHTPEPLSQKPVMRKAGRTLAKLQILSDAVKPLQKLSKIPEITEFSDKNTDTNIIN